MTRPQYIILLTLSALVVVTVLAILGANLGFFPGAQQSQLAKWGPAGALAEIIALFSFVAKIIFGKQPGRFSLLIGPPETPSNLRDFDITLIEWVQENCFVLYGQNSREKVRVVPSRIGRGFRVQFPAGLVEKINPEEAMELQLKDRKGNQWNVKPFLPFENVMPLSVVEPIEKIVRDYGDEGA
ncbi:MAG: hypothetical protein DMG72_17405 [Acidobacteria bacterium]|nr:MAG: hypothetical protein DMG72_17405 [Acidobacteriota bacterium]